MVPHPPSIIHHPSPPLTWPLSGGATPTIPPPLSPGPCQVAPDVDLVVVEYTQDMLVNEGAERNVLNNQERRSGRAQG